MSGCLAPISAQGRSCWANAEGEGGNGAHAGDISEEEELVLPEDVGVNEVVYLAVEVIQFLREELDVFVEALGSSRSLGMTGFGGGREGGWGVGVSR